jgi:hypothetical protein
VAVQPPASAPNKAAAAWQGFGDDRDDAVYGKKRIEAGLRPDDRLFIGDSSNVIVSEGSIVAGSCLKLEQKAGRRVCTGRS